MSSYFWLGYPAPHFIGTDMARPRTSTYVNEETHRKMKLLAAMRGVLLVELVSAALEEWISEQPEASDLHRRASHSTARR